MVKHTQTIRRQQPTNGLSVFDHFVGLAVKVIRFFQTNIELINPFHATGFFLYPILIRPPNLYLWERYETESKHQLADDNQRCIQSLANYLKWRF